MTEPLAGAAAAPLSIRAAATLTSAAVKAARQLLTDLERGRRIDAAVLRGAMEAAFGASDATGAWNWKIAYDACEVATVLFLRKFGSASAPGPAHRPLCCRCWRRSQTCSRPIRGVPKKVRRFNSSRRRSRLAWSHALRLALHLMTSFWNHQRDRLACHLCGARRRHRRAE